MSAAAFPLLVCPPGGKVHVAWPRTADPSSRRTCCGDYVARSWVEVIPGPVSPARACDRPACQKALAEYPAKGLLPKAVSGAA